MRDATAMRADEPEADMVRSVGPWPVAVRTRYCTVESCRDSEKHSRWRCLVDPTAVTMITSYAGSTFRGGETTLRSRDTSHDVLLVRGPVEVPIRALRHAVL